jgi:hypothetical protein
MATNSPFISHISEEAESAALLKEMIQEDFLGLAPLSLRQGAELPAEHAVAQLYEGIAGVLGMTPPRRANLQSA